MHRRVIIAAVAAATLAACSMGGGGGRGGFGMDKGARVEPVTVVETALAEVGAVSDLLVTNATVQSERQADIIPQAAGIVRELPVVEGSAVQKGQVLAVLENVSLNEASVRARSELERLENDLASMKRLYEQGAVSKQELDTLAGQVRAARSTLRESRANAGNTRLVAPFEGFVASRSVRLGQLAPTGQAAMQVVDLKALQVVASLPERDVARVRPGQKAQLVSAYDPDLTADAVVDRVAPVIDAQTGTFQVILSLPSEQRTLRPGQYVTVNLEVDRHEGVTVVPKQAVVYEDGAPVVYRMIDRPEEEESEEDSEDAKTADAAGGGGFSFDFGFGGDEGGDKDEAEEDVAPPSPFVAQRVGIDLGLMDADYAEIVEGISPGDRVVVVGQSNLRDGAPIKTPDMIREEESASEEAEGPEAAGDEGEAG